MCWVTHGPYKVTGPCSASWHTSKGKNDGLFNGIVSNLGLVNEVMIVKPGIFISIIIEQNQQNVRFNCFWSSEIGNREIKSFLWFFQSRNNSTGNYFDQLNWNKKTGMKLTTFCQIDEKEKKFFQRCDETHLKIEN